MAVRRRASRPYTSPRRQEQARQTRALIVEAALGLFTTAGYAATTVAAVAEAAGVAPATVYAAFRSKRGLLEAVLGGGDTGSTPQPPADREPLPPPEALTGPDPRRRVAAAAAVTRDARGRLAALAEITASADPDLAALNRRHDEVRYRSTRIYVDALAAVGALAADLTVDAATDVAWTLSSPEVHRRLVHDRGWTPERYERWLADTLGALLLVADPPSPDTTRR